MDFSAEEIASLLVIPHQQKGHTQKWNDKARQFWSGYLDAEIVWSDPRRASE